MTNQRTNLRRALPTAAAVGLLLPAIFSKILGRPIRDEVVPRDLGNPFHVPDMKNPTPRIRMLDGFNEGWIEFDHGEPGSVKGETDLAVC